MMVPPESTETMTEEVYEWVYDSVTKQRRKITKRNAMGRKCEKCGCNCPCLCADCRPFYCSRSDTMEDILDILAKSRGSRA